MGEDNNDNQLVKRARKGDKSAFDILVRKYQYKVINLVTRYVHDPEEAQDVAQEAFIKAYKGLTKFRGDSAFFTWLYRIAINSAKNYLISVNRRIPDQSVDITDAEQLDGSEWLKEVETPENKLLSKEIERTIYKAIKELPENLKTAITLRELEGMSYEQIAEIMECPTGTVRSRIFRAREAIDKHLKPLVD